VIIKAVDDADYYSLMLQVLIIVNRFQVCVFVTCLIISLARQVLLALLDEIVWDFCKVDGFWVILK
jgi:hypothetical protein